MEMDGIAITARNYLQMAAGVPRTTANVYIERATRAMLEKIASASPEEARRLAMKLLPDNQLVDAPPEDAPLAKHRSETKVKNKQEAKHVDTPASHME